MPADNIERAIKKGSGELEGTTYEEVTYEGYGPGGIAILMDSLTDNRNRTTGEIRHILTKNGGRMADAGAVSYMFHSKGVIAVAKSARGRGRTPGASCSTRAPRTSTPKIPRASRSPPRRSSSRPVKTRARGEGDSGSYPRSLPRCPRTSLRSA